MSEKLNHHFVPQYAFRIFNGGLPYIHILNLKNGMLYKHASVRGQCARHKFYGDQTIENILGGLESKHSRVMRLLVDFADGGMSLSAEEDLAVREAILLQQHRTPKSIAISLSGMRALHGKLLSRFVDHLPDARLRAYARRQIETGQMTLEPSEIAAKLFALNQAIVSTPLVLDLQMIIIKNKTDYPFILSDAPVVALNLFGWRFKNRGVIGLNSPGLMMILPLTSTLQVAIYDGNVYQFFTSHRGCVDLVSTADVSQINALQVHSAEQNIYFSDFKTAGYIADLYAAHSPLRQPLPSSFVSHPRGTMLIDGKLNEEELWHQRQPQIGHELKLSVLKHLIAESEGAVTKGRHPKDSQVYKDCETRQGPFPDLEFEPKLAIHPTGGRG